MLNRKVKLEKQKLRMIIFLKIKIFNALLGQKKCFYKNLSLALFISCWLRRNAC